MIFRRTAIFVTITMTVFSIMALASEKPSQDNDSGRIVLSQELREVLALEMRAIQKGMESLVSAIASGSWHEVSQTATKLRDSYIMKQKLSEKQRKELHHLLPSRFQELDRSFHHSAGMLAHVAEHGHDDLVTFYFYKLSEACVACHSKYATRRFPGFEKPTESEVHHH